MGGGYLVVTDLDGTLLDHYSYEWKPAARALELLQSRDIPLVLCSSKTAPEMLGIRKALGNGDPFIVENGGAIYMPGPEGGEGDMEVIGFGMDRAVVLELLDKAREETGFSFTGFRDMSVSDVIAATGLGEQEAALALQREYSEPVLWQDSEENMKEFVKSLEHLGLDTIQGGRFLHVSAGCYKGRAVAWLKNYYEKKAGTAIRTIVLGDSENDVSMLEQADYPILVKSPVKPFPAVNNDRVYKTEQLGPAGWNEALLRILTSKGKE